MKKTVMRIIFLLLLVFSVSCSRDSGDQNLTTSKLTIIYTNNIAGYTQMCGCRPPMGGLSRRAAILNDLRKDTENMLVLDGGALIYPKKLIYPPYDFSLKIIAQLINDVVSEMGVDAINVTRVDLANGPDSLLAMDRSKPGDWLSANVVWKDSGKLVFKPDRIYSAGDVRVGVFGFMDQKSANDYLFKESDPIKALDPMETARKEVAKLKKESDIIVALAYMDIDRVKRLVNEIPGIDAVIASHTNERRANSIHIPPEWVNNTIIVRTPDGGRVMGRLDFEIINGSTEFHERPKSDNLRPATVKFEMGVSNIKNSFIDLVGEIEPYKPINDKIAKVEKWNFAYRDSIDNSDEYRRDFLDELR